MSKTDKTFIIKLNNWVLYDPDFTKEYTSFFPISKALLHSKLADDLSPVTFKLLIGLLELAHTFGKGEFKVHERLLKGNGRQVESMLSDLQENQILTYSLNKEIKEEIKEGENDNFKLPEIKDENFSQYFSDFVTKKMGSMDLGFIRGYHARAKKAFVTIAGFDEFVEQVMATKTFGEIELKGQMSYFKKACVDEITKRGCL